MQTLENDLISYIKETLGDQFDQSYYSVEIVDAYASVTYKSIAEFNPEIFRDGTKSIQLDYSHSTISITFSNETFRDSKINIRLDNAKSAEHANVITAEMIETMKQNQHKSFFYSYSHEIAIALIFIAGAICFWSMGLAIIISGVGGYVFTYLAIVSAAIVLHSVVCSYVPRCYFDCPAHNRFRANLRHWALFLGGSVITLCLLKPGFDLLVR